MNRGIDIRGAVGVLLIFSALYALAFVGAIGSTVSELVSRITLEPNLIAPWILASAGILAGHTIRALRARILFNTTVKTSFSQQMGTFCVGSLCNTVLPLRLGELVRADAIAQATKTSFSFSFALVMLERTADATIVCLLLAPFGLFSMPLITVATLLAGVLWLLWRSPSWFKRLVSVTSDILKEDHRTRLLFRLWSVEYGLKRTFVPSVLLPWTALTVLNWSVYILALIPLFQASLGSNGVKSIMSSVAAFAALSSSITPGALGAFTPTLAGWGLSDPTAYIMAWMAAVLPTGIIGFVWALVGLKDVPLFRTGSSYVFVATDDKLSREVNIAASQAAFLRDYYAGVTLAAEISRDDMEGVASVGRYFTGGGSAAVTYLSRRKGTLWVTKRVDLPRAQSLREQHAWLVEHACPNVAVAGAEREDNLTYSMDVGYDSESVDGFEWVHQCSLLQARSFINEVIQTLAEQVWVFPDKLEMVTQSEGNTRVKEYIDKHVITCMDLATHSLPSLGAVTNPRVLVINGVEHSNLNMLLSELEENEAARRDLASFRTSPSIHGDPIIDNLLWSRGGGHPVIIDPVPCGNIFDGPVFDFGKWSQSLQIGYEFKLRDTSPVLMRNDIYGVSRVIEYQDIRSARYEELWRYIYNEVAPQWLTESERRTILFIGATNYFRRMKHQVIQCPQNALKFYALGVKYLDEWMELYR